MLVDKEKVLSHFDNDKALIAEMLIIFEQTYIDIVARLEVSLINQETKKTELEVHTLKGMLMNFFCNELVQVATMIETKIKTTNTKEVTVLVQQIKESIPAMIEEVRELIV